MTALSAAAFAVALQCAHGVDPDLLSGFATVESAVNPLVIHQNIRGTPGHTYSARSIDEAVRISLSLIAAGQSIDTGPFQINNANLDLLQITLPDTFDTCHAAAAAARLLALMSRYNSGSPTAAFAYAKRVTAAMSAVKAGAGASQATPNPPVDPSQPPAWDMEAVAEWRRVHAPSPEDAADAPSEQPPAVAEPIVKEDPK